MPANSLDDDLDFLSFHKSPETSSIKVCAPVDDILVSNQTKTVGRLERGPAFPVIYAKSGSIHDGEDLVTISGEHWIEEVFRLRRMIKHSLPRDPRDGSLGSYYACPAEKQLVAYFLRKHVFLRDEIGEDDGETTVMALYALVLAEALGDNAADGPQATGGNLRDLHTARPPVSLQRATILVSSEVCVDCRAFV